MVATAGDGITAQLDSPYRCLDEHAGLPDGPRALALAARRAAHAGAGEVEYVVRDERGCVTLDGRRIMQAQAVLRDLEPKLQQRLLVAAPSQLAPEALLSCLQACLPDRATLRASDLSSPGDEASRLLRFVSAVGIQIRFAIRNALELEQVMELSKRTRRDHVVAPDLLLLLGSIWPARKAQPVASRRLIRKALSMTCQLTVAVHGEDETDIAGFARDHGARLQVGLGVSLTDRRGAPLGDTSEAVQAFGRAPQNVGTLRFTAPNVDRRVA